VINVLWLSSLMFITTVDSLENDYLKILVSKDATNIGKFALMTNSGNPEFDDSGLLLLYVDEDRQGFTSGFNVHVFDWEGPIQDYATSAIQKVYADKIRTEFEGPIEFTQDLSLVKGPNQDYEGFLKIEITAKNIRESLPLLVGMRLLLDTKLGTYSARSDGSLVRIPGTIPTTFEQMLHPPFPALWAVSEDRVPANLHAFGLINYPPFSNLTNHDSLGIVLLGTGTYLRGGIYETNYNYPITSNKNYRDDTAIAYWREDYRWLEIGESFTLKVYYGLGLIDCFKIDAKLAKPFTINTQGFYEPDTNQVKVKIQNIYGADIESCVLTLATSNRLQLLDNDTLKFNSLALFDYDSTSVKIAAIAGTASTETLYIKAISPCTTSTTLLIPLSEIPRPFASFTYQGLLCAGEEITFINTSTGNVDSIKWILPDGSESIENQIFYTFPRAGEYKIILVAYSSTGFSDTAQQILLINDKPIPAFTQVTYACEQETLVLRSLTNADNYTWIINNDTISSEIELRYFLSSSNSVKICFRVSNNSECQNDTCFYVQPGARPVTNLVLDTINWCKDSICISITPFLTNNAYNLDIGADGKFDWLVDKSKVCLKLKDSLNLALNVTSDKHCNFDSLFKFTLSVKPPSSFCCPEVANNICWLTCVYPENPYCVDSITWSHDNPLAKHQFNQAQLECINKANLRLERNGAYSLLTSELTYHPDLCGLKINTQASRNGQLAINLPQPYNNTNPIYLLILNETTCSWQIDSAIQRSPLGISSTRQELNGIYTLAKQLSGVLLKKFAVYPIPISINDSLKIEYELGKQAEITFEVFTTFGGKVIEKITPALSKFGEIGKHNYKLRLINSNGRELASGAYILRTTFRSGSEKQTKIIKFGIYR
jgi:hypothetical protein